jgi:hypothetical protein
MVSPRVNGVQLEGLQSTQALINVTYALLEARLRKKVLTTATSVLLDSTTLVLALRQPVMRVMLDNMPLERVTQSVKSVRLATSTLTKALPAASLAPLDITNNTRDLTSAILVRLDRWLLPMAPFLVLTVLLEPWERKQPLTTVLTALRATTPTLQGALSAMLVQPGSLLLT